MSWFSTTLGGGDYALSATTVATSVEMAASPGNTLQLVVGEIVGGSLRLGDRPAWSLNPGVVGGLSFSRALWSSNGFFLLGTASASFSMSGTIAGPVRALDFRGGVAFGRSFGPVTPYLMARGFGGPVTVPTAESGSTVVGDTRHFTVGLGVSARLGVFDVGGEAAPLGERRATATAGVSF